MAKSKSNKKANLKKSDLAKKISSSPSKASDKKKKKETVIPLFDSNNIYEVFARLFVIAMSIVFPLAIGSEKYSNITHFKNVTFYVIAAISFSALIVTLIIKIMSIPADEFSLAKYFTGIKVKSIADITDIAVLCYWFILFISTLMSKYPAVAIFGQGVRNDGFIIQTFYVATYFVISHLIRLQKFDLNIYCLGGAAVAVLSIFHFFGIDLLDTGFTKPNWISHLNFMGPMGNINLTSYFVTVALILAAGLYVTQQYMKFDTDGRWLLLCFGIMLFAELNLNTDAGIVAIGVVLLASLPLLITSFKRLGRMLMLLSSACGVVVLNQLIVNVQILHKGFGTLGWAAAIFGIVCIAAGMAIKYEYLKLDISGKTLLYAGLSIDAAAVVGGLIVAFIAANTQTKGTLYELGQMLFHGNFNDHFGTNRLFTWKRTLKLSGKHFIFGSGPDTFCNVFQEAYGEESSAFFGGRNLDKAHNEYLQLLICSGFTSLAAFLTFIGSMITDAFKRMTENPMLVSCALAVIGYSVHAFFGYSLPINSPLMWVLFGLTGAAMRVKAEA